MRHYRHESNGQPAAEGERDFGNGCKLTFMIRSGLNVPTPAMPMPDLAVPYAAPAHPNIMAAAIPPCMQLPLSADEAQYRHIC